MTTPAHPSAEAARPGALSTTQLEDLIRHARVLPLDIVQAKGNGHAGTAVSLTPLLTVLHAHHLRHDPQDPGWRWRDRFILSCGHASLALYLQLFLWGYGLEMEDLAAARRLGSLTPGHPERGMTPGVEMSTGPLGQGIAAAVGAAMEERRIRELLTPGESIDRSPLGHRTWCMVSDGDLSEGISSEAAALAGRAGLPGLIVIWDDNGITIDGTTSISTVEDVTARFEACGWRTLELDDAEDLQATERVLLEATHPGPADTRPVFLRVRTRIGHPMPVVGGTPAAHAGPVGDSEIAATRTALGLDPHHSFDMPEALLSAARTHARERGAHVRSSAETRLARWRDTHQESAALLDRLSCRGLPSGWEQALPDFGDQTSLATRSASGKILAALSPIMPELWGGSCDLSGSTSTVLPGDDDFTPEHAGRTIRFGIREHAQAAALSGMNLSGLTRPFGSTYLIFSDYQRPAIRLAALMGLPSLFIWTHDSLAVGEDGPTHQPVEQLASLRAVPGMSVVRPCDAWETRAAWREILHKDSGPVGLVLSRQGLPVLTGHRKAIDEGTSRGAYILADFPQDTARTPTASGAAHRVVLLASGSEVHVALSAREALRTRDVSARVVSVPCMEWFTQQPASYRDQVLPPDLRARVSVEAGVPQPWGGLVGIDGASIGVEEFGHSGDGPTQLATAGFTAQNVCEVALQVLDGLGRGVTGRE